MGVSTWPELLQGFTQPVEGLLAEDGAFAATLHGANDGGRAEAAGEVDDAGDEVAGLAANLRVGIGQAQFVDDPAGAGAHGGELELVLFEELLELPGVQVFGSAGKDLHRIEAVGGGASASGGEVIPEDKRSAARFGHEEMVTAL